MRFRNPPREAFDRICEATKVNGTIADWKEVCRAAVDLSNKHKESKRQRIGDVTLCSYYRSIEDWEVWVE